MKEGGVDHHDPDPQMVLKELFSTPGGGVEIGMPCRTSYTGGPLKNEVNQAFLSLAVK